MLVYPGHVIGIWSSRTVLRTVVFRTSELIWCATSHHLEESIEIEHPEFAQGPSW